MSDYKKYLIDKTPKEISLAIAFCDNCGKNGLNSECTDHCSNCPDDEKVELTTRTLGATRREAILTSYLSWDNDGNSSFSVDQYTKECLTEIIVNAPWGKTTELFFTMLGDELYEALKTLVPKPFTAGTSKVSVVKKE